MYKMDIAQGVLVLLGFLLILAGIVAKLSGLNLLEHIITMPSNFFVGANTCFLIALILAQFGKSEKKG